MAEAMAMQSAYADTEELGDVPEGALENPKGPPTLKERQNYEKGHREGWNVGAFDEIKKRANFDLENIVKAVRHVKTDKNNNISPQTRDYFTQIEGKLLSAKQMLQSTY